MVEPQEKAKERKFPYIPQALMYEFLQALRLNIGGIPKEGFNFHLIRNLRAAFAEVDRGSALLERVKTLDLLGAGHIRQLLDSITLLDDFVNPNNP